MATKIEAARIADAAGVVTVVTGRRARPQVLGGDDVGTVFTPIGRPRASRRLWLEHATTARGRLIVDAGAVAARCDRKKSLLPAGITGVEGTFHDGDPVDVCSPDGTAVARGLVNYSVGRAAAPARDARRGSWPGSSGRSTSARSSTATTSSSSRRYGVTRSALTGLRAGASLTRFVGYRAGAACSAYPTVVGGPGVYRAYECWARRARTIGRGSGDRWRHGRAGPSQADPVT